MPPSRTAPRRAALTALLALAIVPGTAAAARGPHPSAPRPPLVLPGAAGAASHGADPATWIIAGRPGADTRSIARRYGARAVSDGGAVFSVRRAAARPLAGALRRAGRLAFAEPNVRYRRHAFPTDPMSASQSWLSDVVAPSLTPPPVTDASPLVAMLDSQVDASHPEWRGGRVTLADASVPMTDDHGTAVTAIAGAPANGTGVLGVWPGMRVLDVPNELDCATSSRAVDAAVAAGARVINMSYGGPFCYAHYVATQEAHAHGAVLVAAAGNERAEGNPPEFPASDPHVITVGATDARRRPADFSNSNPGVDLAAPGEDLLTAVPVEDDEDGAADGYARVSGTSFSAPIVSAAAAWVLAWRPGLSPDQVAGVLTAGARDVGAPGRDLVSGHGLVDVAGALARPAPPRDLAEPNDDVEWVDGSHLAFPRPLLSGAASSTSLSATVDQWEDPADVYPVRVPAGTRLRVRLAPGAGDPDLTVFDQRARTIDSSRARIAASRRNGRAVDSVVVSNRSRRARIAYVAIWIDEGVRAQGASYRLGLRRIR